MAASRDKSNDASRPVQFTKDAAQEIAETVRIVRGGNRGQSAMHGAANAQAASHYLSKTTSAWTKGTSQTLTIYVGEAGSETASTGDTVVAWNKFSDIASNSWVMLARANGTFYLVAAEC